MFHLGWSVPMADPSYYVQGAGIHSFLMFAPFFALWEKKGMWLQGMVLFFTGPVLAGFISPNLMEQASIWCFFSIAQVLFNMTGLKNVYALVFMRGCGGYFLLFFCSSIFSSQILVMLFLIRETLLDVWGKSDRKLSSKASTKDENGNCKYFVKCEYCDSASSSTQKKSSKQLK
jgi:hypothetical protein